MNLNSILCVLYATIITLSLVYAPQPLAPLLGDYFHISAHNASSIISLTLLPMAFAPTLYGYLLEKFSPKKILILSMFSCGILQFLSTMSDVFYIFLFLRGLQSLFFPAILTTLLTILTRLNATNIQKNTSLYVSATITGGLIGRVLGSYLTNLFSWQISFNFFAILMILGGFWALRIRDTNQGNLSKITLKEILPFFKDKSYVWILVSVFIMFFSFQAILCVLPFFLVDTNPNIGESQIGFVYIGYLIGIVVSLFASKTTLIFHSKSNAVCFSFLVFGIGILIMIINHMYMLLLGMFVLCAGSFSAHSILSALINSISKNKKGIVNGLYLTFYYSGGVLGSFVPIFFYDQFGWSFICIFIAMLLFLNSFLFFKHKQLYRKV
ncbi:MFS transporter [Helicobacter sp. 11S03491-1]|uniref:MFS transporter n=1 Tax=Helicobacter sp. 11S03491-1 TaxID=1476196 RepID=UPI000BA50A6D|nr:MFS transporter [Helicobacter sp. 11S03491-1]PAF41728.1 MFS transporter [Helicobacter sp. 11S03491-1]